MARTTLEIDDAVLAAARSRAQLTGRSLGKIISEMAQASLQAGSVTVGSDVDFVYAAHGLRVFGSPAGHVVTSAMVEEALVDV